MTRETKQLAVKALWQMRGDSLERAKLEFRGQDAEAMSQPWGRYGRTKQQVLDFEEGEAAKIEAAIKEIESL